MLKKISILTITIFWVSISVMKAQNPSWSAELGGKASWLDLNFTGVLIAGGGDALYGIDPISKKTKWKLTELAGISEEDLDQIPASQYATVDKGSGKDISQSTLVDLLNGKILYDTQKDGAKGIFSKNVLPSIGGILLEVIKDGQIQLILIDLKTGNIVWSKSSGKASLGNLIKKGFRDNTPDPAIASTDKEGNIILPYDGEKLMRINAKTGDVLWAVDKRVASSFFFSKDGNTTVCVVNDVLSNRSKVSAYNLSDGADLWGEQLKLEGSFLSQIARDEDFIVIHDRGFNMIDYRSGKSKWEKEKTFKDISKIIQTEDGFIIAQENNVDYIGLNGKSIWKKEVEVAEKDEVVNFLVKTDKGVLFISPTLTNMLDLASGKPLWKKELKMKKNPLGAYDAIRDKYLAFTNGDLYLIDQNAGEYKLLAENIKFQFGESPVNIEARANGYFLSSAQNAVFVTLDGKIEYQKGYKESKLIRLVKGFAKFLKFAGEVGGALGYSVFLASDMSRQEYYSMMSTFYGTTDAIAGVTDPDLRTLLEERAKRRKELSNYKFITTSAPGAGFEQVSIVQLAKDTGEEVKVINLNDQAPIYEVDELGKLVYFVVDNQIQCFQLQD